jgi:hypothetical protein
MAIAIGTIRVIAIFKTTKRKRFIYGPHFPACSRRRIRQR